MIKKFVYLLLLLPSLLIGGCKKFVDIRPEDSYIDEQLFSNAAGIRQALNGIYTGLASENLYGARLTMEAVDIISKQYDLTPVVKPLFIDIANNYSVQGEPGSTFDVIWNAAYVLILKTNDFIAQLQKVKGKGLVTEAQYAQLMGEAIAIRAFIHLDMLRLYGPQFLDNPDQLAIPYNTMNNADVKPLLSFGLVMDSVLTDLGRAEQLLVNDPVISRGVVVTGDIDFYSSFRNRRMNYYSVKALQARTYMYYGKKDLARAAARTVVENADQTFPWTPFSAVVGSANPDRIFSSEILFGIQNANLYSLYNTYFSAGFSRNTMLVPSTAQLTAVFEGNENDYRFRSSWLPGPLGIRTFYKYADLDSTNKSWRFFQPLIRKSEMYYIMAETDPVPAQAINYLNVVRRNRGLTDLLPNAKLTGSNNQIEKEYVREFYGEGQLYFYFKRVDAWWKGIPSFVVTLPVSETQLR